MTGKNNMANLANMSRPSTFGSAIGEAARLNGEIIRNQVRTGKISHTYLMTGLKGSGKTTTARTLARALNCLDLKDGEPCGCCPNCRKIQQGEAMDVKEIDAARNNGVDFAKSIEEDASYQPLEMGKKVYILDECHCMTADAFSSLLKLIEEPPEWCVFIFCTTDPQKMPVTIRSRCQEFRFKAVSIAEMSAHLIRTAEGCGARLDADAAEAIARHSGGSVRDALMSLEVCLGEEADITAARVNEILGIESWQQVFMMLDAVTRSNRMFIINAVDRYYAEGRRVTDVITDCMTAVTDRLRHLAGAEFDGNDEYHRLVSSLELTEERAFGLADALREVYEKIRYSSDKGMLTVALLRAASSGNSLSEARLAEAERRIAELEKRLSSGNVQCGPVQGNPVKKAEPADAGPEAVELPDIFAMDTFFMDDFMAQPVPGVAETPDVGPEEAPEALTDGPAGMDVHDIPVADMETAVMPPAEETPVLERAPDAAEDIPADAGPELPDGFFSEPACPPDDSRFVPAEGMDVPFDDAPAPETPDAEDVQEEPAEWSDGLSLDQLFDAMDNGASPEMKLEWECNVNSFLKNLVAGCGRKVTGKEVILVAPNKDIAEGIQCCLDAARDLGCVKVEVGS